jgi:SAM-dependent methyltransferase
LHNALRAEFAAIVAQTPGLTGAQVVDVGCGDGFFVELLLEAGAGRVLAVDTDPAFLAAAGRRLSDHVDAGRVRLLSGDARRLPFDAGSVDVVWSAHSMQSYDDIPQILAEFHRVLHAGGTLAVLESDSIHSVMLPWPPRLELAVREAERRTLGDADDRMGAYFPRYAARLIAGAGFVDFAARPTLIHRSGPLDDRMTAYVQMYLRDLLDRLGDEGSSGSLDADARARAAAFADSFARPAAELWMSSLQVLFTSSAAM